MVTNGSPVLRPPAALRTYRRSHAWRVPEHIAFVRLAYDAPQKLAVFADQRGLERRGASVDAEIRRTACNPSRSPRANLLACRVALLNSANSCFVCEQRGQTHHFAALDIAQALASARAHRTAARRLRLPRRQIAAPLATNKCALSGTMMACSSSSSSVSQKRLSNSERYCKGPPRNATLPRMGRPHARPEMVCVTTAWKMEAAMSSLRAPSLSSGCTSVFANTPQRLAMG